MSGTDALCWTILLFFWGAILFVGAANALDAVGFFEGKSYVTNYCEVS